METVGVTDIKNVLDSNVIKINLNVKDKHDAIKQLSELLKSAHYVDDIDSFIKDIYVRESEGITGLGNGVAIPHGKSKGVTKIGVAIGILNHGIKWESLDSELIKVVILFAVSDDNSAASNQLKLLSLFASKLAYDNVLNNLKKAKTVAEVIHAFD